MSNFEEIYKENQIIIYRFLMRICLNPDLAQEITQETLYKAFLHINEFKGKCKISSWLCQIAKNEYFYRLRQNKKFFDMDITDLDKINVVDHGDGMFIKVEDQEQVALIISILNTMKSPYCDVFTEKVLMNLDYQEISRLHEKSETWARVTYFRAKSMLIERMGEL